MLGHAGRSAVWAGAFVLGGLAGAQDLPTFCLGTLASAVEHLRTDVACHGGYLWRYRADMSEREGEEKATPSQVWVQPPGTPSVGLAMLEAYRLTGLEPCRDGAIEGARALVWGQLACGGWDYLIDFDPDLGRKWYTYRDKQAGLQPTRGQRSWAVFDDNTTQHALRLLMAVDRELGFRDEEIHQATLRGLQCVLDAQFPNGAWPQGWPLPEGAGYARYATFNDNAIGDCLSVMLEAHVAYHDDRYLQAARRAGDFILASQLPPPQAGWAQQYDEQLQPAPARWFEPAALSSAESVMVIRSLMELFCTTREPRYLDAIPPALEWLQASRLENGKWARFHEVGTNKPLYVNLQREVVNVFDDTIRPGYSWQGEYGIPGLVETYERLKRDVADGTVKWTIPPPPVENPTAEANQAEARRLAPAAQELCETLNAEGNWVRDDGWFYMEDLNRNLRVLARYLHAVQALNATP
jgi:PelA/Pel-15E family pectate lyase